MGLISIVIQRMIIIARDLNSETTHAAFTDALERLCTKVDLTVCSIPHLYHLPEDSAFWDVLRNSVTDFTLACWIHPRPAEWLLRRHGVTRCRSIINMGTFPSPEACLSALLESEPDTSEPGLPLPEISESLTPRWYPVVDGSRCIHCRRCLQFCLFGVYTLDGENVRVTQPNLCKAGCPACSRICPNGAIVFPLYAKDPTIAGAPGLFMSPDPAAMRMYYQRTKQACPRCGGTPEQADTQYSDHLCEECGRPIPIKSAVPHPALDDLDLLIDELAHKARKRN